MPPYYTGINPDRCLTSSIRGPRQHSNTSSAIIKENIDKIINNKTAWSEINSSIEYVTDSPPSSDKQYINNSDNNIT